MTEQDPPPLINGVHCLVCHTDVVSRHVHDFRWCACPGDPYGGGGSQVFVDGGLEYARRGWGAKSHFRDLQTGEITKGSQA